MNNLSLHVNKPQAQDFIDSVKSKKFLFSFVLSYTETCEIPGITAAGANSDSMRFTPPADAEYVHYGYCKTISGIPMTPDGKPTPALLTKAALESASIPHIVINAGSCVSPRLPYIDASLPSGGDISIHDALTEDAVSRAVDYGRIIGRSLASVTDCLVIGESMPGGTTTALATLRAMGYTAMTSSSMPQNPVRLKNDIVNLALRRAGMYRDRSLAHKQKSHDNKRTQQLQSSQYAPLNHLAYSIIARVGDPMIPFVAGMLSSASTISKVLLAGGTQMAAVLGFASCIGFETANTAIGTTSYVVKDQSANFVKLVTQIAPKVPAISVDPCLGRSKHYGLRAFSKGFAKEGAGAGGCIISSMLRSGSDPIHLLRATENEYDRLSKTVTLP